MKKTNISKVYNSLFIKHFVINLTSSLCTMVSGYFAGNYLDNIAMSCNSLVSPLNSFIVGISAIFSTSSEILCGKFMGKGDKKSINQAFTNAVVSAITIGIGLTILIMLFSDGTIRFLGANNELAAPAGSYLRGFAIGVIPYLLLPLFTTFLHMENESKYATFSAVVLTATYVGFGYLFIVTLDMGYFGFGLTTAASNIVTVLFLLAKIIQNHEQISFDIKSLNLGCFKELVVLGIPTGVSRALIGARNLILNNILLYSGGVIAMAAKSVQGSTLIVIDSFTQGLIQTTIVLASVCIGEKNKEELLSLFKHVFIKMYLVFVALLVGQSIFAEPISAIFTHDSSVIAISVWATRLYAPSAFFEGICNILLVLYVVFDFKSFVNFNTFTHSFLIHVVYSIVTFQFFGPYSVFSGYLACELITFIIITVFVAIKNKRLPFNLVDYLLLPQDFGKGIFYSKTISKYEEVPVTGREVYDFCVENDAESRVTKLVPICIEEISSNTFEHGYTKKKVKDKRVDIFVSFEKETVDVRIRDNAIPFNPTTRNTVFNPDDPCKNIGIRLLSEVSNEISYQNLFGFNNTIIKINKC